MAYIGNRPPAVSNLLADIKIGEDDETKIDFETADEIHFYAANAHEITLAANELSPNTSNGIALGTGTKMWSDLFLASGAVMDFNNGNVTITHTNGTGLTINSTNKLMFGDAASFIQQSSDGVLRIDGEATIDLNASTEVNVSAALTAGGIIKTDDTTNATSTTDGSLQTDGGLSVALDGIFGDDVTLITDSSVLNLGIGSDVSLTHDGTTGGTLSGTPMTIESLGASALANNNYTGIVLTFLAHEAITQHDAVYIHTDDGEIGRADANALATMPAIGVAMNAADAYTGSNAVAATVKVLTHGIYNDSDGFGGSDLTEGSTMYLGETTGAVTATIPDADGDFVQVMGIACGPRDVFINPSLDIIERA